MLLTALAAGCLAAVDIPDTRLATYVTPARILWISPEDGCSVKDAELLLGPRFGQVPEGAFWKGSGCLLTNAGKRPGLLLDFGREIHGGIELGCGLYTEDAELTRSTVACRVRFGESVSEAMAELGERGTGNWHAMRDTVETVMSTGLRTFGDTGFRFVRIDLVDEGTLQLDYVRAVSKMRPMQSRGAFRSSDERLNRIYATAVQTAHLCAQRFIWDGIKRDRLVWGGDMYPQVVTILSVFGDDPVVIDSIDYLGKVTPPDKWMCIPSYSMWWIRALRDWYFFTGDAGAIRERADYLRATFDHLSKHIAEDGRCTVSNAVLDWPTRKNPPAAVAGHQALFSDTFRRGAEIAEALGDAAWAADMTAKAAKTALAGLEPHGSKPAAAMLAYGGLRDSKEMFAESLGCGGHNGISTFFGYFMIETMSAAGENQYALDTIRDYWGAMLDMGATSFWESFDISWTNNATRIDELPVPGKKDIHGDYGEFCYKGCRHSLCHGWSCGPAAWCIHHVLGIRALDAGCKTVAVKPFLGDLEWAEGAMALPGGKALKVRVEKRADGTLKTSVSSPEGVKVIVTE